MTMFMNEDNDDKISLQEEPQTNFDEDVAMQEREDCCCSQNSQYLANLDTEETSSFIEEQLRM